MSGDSGLYRVAAERIPLPPIAAYAAFEWDGIEMAYPFIKPRSGTELGCPHLPSVPSFTLASWQVPCLTTAARHASSSLIDSEIGCADSSPSQPIDWEKEVSSLTIYLDPRLLLAAAHDMVPRVTGELVWVYRRGRAQLISLYVHPVLLVGVTYESPRFDPVEIILHPHSGDPLLYHITLVLKAAIDTGGMAGRLYTESITNALAIHLLRRFTACGAPAEACPGGLPKSKLRRVTEYVEAHLDYKLSLPEIAAVVQMSPDHFARLFRQAMGRTPHQYVVTRRIERAK